VFVAIFALKLGTEVPITTFPGGYPRAIRPGRDVAKVLRMPAGQVRHPVAFIVLVVINNFLFHAQDLSAYKLCEKYRRRRSLA
jgi:hypothetical protein